MEKYLVQIKTDSGEIFNSIKTEKEIIYRIDLADIHNEQIRIYYIGKFGKIEPLSIYGCWHNAEEPLLIKVVNENEEVMFSGYGTDH